MYIIRKKKTAIEEKSPKQPKKKTPHVCGFLKMKNIKFQNIIIMLCVLRRIETNHKKNKAAHIKKNILKYITASYKK